MTEKTREAIKVLRLSLYTVKAINLDGTLSVKDYGSDNTLTGYVVSLGVTLKTHDGKVFSVVQW